MIDGAGWLDWTTKKPGIPDKVYPDANAGKGLVCHSVEGYGIPQRFWDTTKDAGGNYVPNAQASVMFINPLEGALIQCYAVTGSPWTSGNRIANTTLWPVESEGVAGTPLNDNQVANMIRLATEWEAAKGKVATRQGIYKTVWEHNEVWYWSTPNAGPTACPSHRYDGFYRRLDAGERYKEEDMADAELKKQLDDLNAAAMQREDIRAVASGSYANVQKAHDLLKKGGLIP